MAQLIVLVAMFALLWVLLIRPQRKRQLEQIQRKVDGQEIIEEPTEAPKTQILDLMAALKASLGKGKGAAGDRKPAKRVEDKAAAKTIPLKRKAASR